MAELTGADDDQRRVVVLPVNSALDGLEHLVAEHLVAEHLMTIGNPGRYTGLPGRPAVFGLPRGA